jgi:Putative Flp pilus-assembly TadE/G-like
MRRERERGQILPIGAVAILVLLGIAGLVMDVGATWMLLRREQAAADVGSIAAARYIPDGDVAGMQTAACFYARENGFYGGRSGNNGTGCTPANDANASVLRVDFPPTTGPYAGRAGYVQVAINGSHSTFFSRVFGINSMAAAADAISGNVETTGTGGQLVALDPTSCGAGKIRGNGTVDVDGSIYVNSDGSGPPACVNTFNDACESSDGAFRFEGTNARLVTPLVSVRGTCGQNSNPYPANCGTPPCGMSEGAPQIEDPFNLPTPTRAWAGVPAAATSNSGAFSLAACDAATDTGGCSFAGGGSSWYELHPGVYYGGLAIQRTVCLHQGFYYIAGGGLQLSGNGRLITLSAGETCAQVMAGTVAGGDGRILIYQTDGPDCPTSPAAGDRRCQGTITIEGNSTSAFRARGYEETGTVVNGSETDDDYHRILMWQAERKEDGVTPTSRTYPGETNFDNDKIRVAGQGALDFWGTVYAPRSIVEIQGQGAGDGDVAGVQVLAWRFDIGGNGLLNMPFDPDELSAILAKGLVH